jgi:hypothetical protein
MRRIFATAVALALTLGVLGASTGAAHASVARNGTYTLNTTVTYTCTAVGGPACPTGTESYVRTYSVTGDCATNAFTGIGTGPDQVGETLSGQVTGNNLTFTVTSSGALTTFTGSFTGPDTYAGTATNTYFSGAPNDTFTATGVITSSDFSQCTNHGQYVKS